MFRSPLFSWSPRPDQDPLATPASQSPSRFGAFQSNIRTMINGSSIYSQSPGLGPSNHDTPKVPFLGFLGRRPHSPDGNILPTSNDVPRESNDSRSPLHPQHTAGSYMRTIAPLQDPREPATIYSRHPADVPLPHQPNGYADPEVQELADDIHGRRRRRKHKKRKHRRTEQWVRRRDERGGRGSTKYVKGTAARAKMFACAISGTFLIIVLAIYLAIALTNRDLGQEVHILFILVLLTITIFFCHSLIRLCMLMLNPPREGHRPHLPAMTGPDGFQPIVPIRVHLARDVEAGASDEEAENDMDIEDPEKDKIPPPPPAYGLWRCSVRADPNLLHWQRVENRENRASITTDIPYTHNASAIDPPGAPPLAPASGPRPPSYISEDGVSYIIEAAPRSTVNNRESSTGVSDIHPAWRPGYAMSEVRGNYGVV
ncbi:uncharacterized protein K460DRAFT_373519 [Cucurbitaria berberidis CBS 394.84]|uniref:Uncharacterized protein n=1 Tax=Cucurbitaria berberidis CBS 394.84 TaxID=1168544 RepID=A0A9P4GUJ1_9PLEO|nr:uncharacterized protein K460DRAFT_373519 [Cucurbitaria berberidis CBS 394.84]KAF1851529.1 hypothetical protein K460DRAFT_373519 [Cucurbitaria berberidis CBS 394.84]